MESMIKSWCILRNLGHKRLTFWGTRRVITATRGFPSVSASPNAFCKYLKQPEQNRSKVIKTTMGHKGLGPIFLGPESLKDSWAILRRGTTFIAGQFRSSLMMSMCCNNKKRIDTALQYFCTYFLQRRLPVRSVGEKGAGKLLSVSGSQATASIPFSTPCSRDTMLATKLWTCYALPCLSMLQSPPDQFAEKALPWSLALPHIALNICTNFELHSAKSIQSDLR